MTAMRDQLSQRQRIEKCLDKLNPTQFEALITAVLSLGEQDELSAPLDEISKPKFLNDMARWEYLDRVEEELREQWSELLSDILETGQVLEPASSSSGHIAERQIEVKFVNREAELDEIFRSAKVARTKYWIVDAPVGYGKSKLLREICKYYTNEGWTCGYVEMSRADPPSLRKLGKDILESLGCPREALEDVEDRIGYCIAGTLMNRDDTNPPLSQTQRKGIAIFLDNIEALGEEDLSGLAEVVEEIFKGLENSGFLKRQNTFLCFFSGRDARKRLKIRAFENLSRLTEKPLSPFCFDVVQETVRQYALEVDADPPNIATTAAHLMYLTGGHPGCMAYILSEIAHDKFAQAPQVLEDPLEEFRKEVFKVIKQLEVDVQEVMEKSEDPDLVPILKTLSVFRKYRPWLLQWLKESGIIDWDKDEYQLEKALLDTYLLERRPPFLQNEISRRLFSIHLRLKESDTFNDLCEESVSLFKKRLELSNLRSPEAVAVEWLYQKLQYEYYVNEKRGNDLLEEIEQAATIAISSLEEKWPRPDMVPDFIDALREDWELEFLVNYLTNRREYDNETYERLLRNLSQDLLEGEGKDD